MNFSGLCCHMSRPSNRRWKTRSQLYNYEWNRSAYVIRGSCKCSSESVASFYSNSTAQVTADATTASLFQTTFKTLGLTGHPTSEVQRVKIHQSTLPGYGFIVITMKLTNLSRHQSLKLVTG